ncbi:glycine-rich cell wall structural protein 1.8 [Drosophila innubila]|uniref:glycine-rich cell wall structural protein 1.8 n=1 Tax=Drosophila innubila TaxID=198719 RepID=UPI00148CDAAA|nr:glycine-rich cell wall structural protein 1.8 [Drosophila innubila]
MFGFQSELLAKRSLLLLLLGCVQLSRAQNASTVVWEPSNGNTSKREVSSSSNGLDYAGTNIAKSYDPPPEFYRGPGSSSGSVSGSYVGSTGAGIGGISGIGGSGGTQLGSVGESLSETYNKWRHGAGSQQRISVGHYGGGIGGGVAAHVPSTHGAAGYAYEGHPYEYAGGNHHGGYYGGNSAEAGIPFDVYGARPSHGSHHAHYGHTGGEYAYLEPHDVASHKGPPELSHKALLAKSFLIPLASAAVLGIAAALVSNPLLLQLGTVSGVGGGLGPVVGKRKRRALRRAYAAHN